MAMEFFPQLQNNPLVKQDPVFLAVETVFLNHVLKKTASEISKGERKLLVSLNAVFHSDFTMFGFNQSKYPIIFKKTIDVRPGFHDDGYSQPVNGKSLRKTSILFHAWFFKNSQELQIISNKCEVDINPNHQENTSDKINGTNKLAQIFILGPLYSNILMAEDMLKPICMEELNAPRRE